MYFFFKILFIHLRHRDTEREREHEQWERQRERKKQTPRRVRSPMWDSIPGPRDHDLSRRQTLNHLSHPGAPNMMSFDGRLGNVFQQTPFKL